jgi:hypothetical protein
MVPQGSKNARISSSLASKGILPTNTVVLCWSCRESTGAEDVVVAVVAAAAVVEESEEPEAGADWAEEVNDVEEAVDDGGVEEKVLPPLWSPPRLLRPLLCDVCAWLAPKPFTADRLPPPLPLPKPLDAGEVTGRFDDAPPALVFGPLLLLVLLLREANALVASALLDEENDNADEEAAEDGVGRVGVPSADGEEETAAAAAAAGVPFAGVSVRDIVLI